MSGRGPGRRSRGTGAARGAMLAAFLAIALLAVLTPAFLQKRPAAGSRIGARSPSAGDARWNESSPPLEMTPGTNGTRGTDADPGAARLAERSAAPDALATLHATIPALERIPWAEIEAALSAGFDARRPPRAVRALALEVAGIVRTTAMTGPGELTHPAVLTRILEEVLARGSEPLTAAQRDEVASLARLAGGEIERAVESMGSRPRLASTIAEIEAKLDFIEGIGELLSGPQREGFQRLAAGEGAPLSPLGLISVREVEFGGDAVSFRRGFAAELAREFQIDLVLAESLAARYGDDLAPLLDGSASDLTPEERAFAAARAQARTLEDLLRAPGLSEEARERAKRLWVVNVPRARR